MIGFISTLVTVSLSHIYCRQYSVNADLHTLQFTVAHALGFSASTSRLLATDLNTETITLNCHEVFLLFYLFQLTTECHYHSELTAHSSRYIAAT
jgi:hypothetical protein